MFYIVCGAGIPIHLILAIIESVIFGYNKNIFEFILFGLWIPIGLILEYYCCVQRDNVRYNELLEKSRQMNLFRDFDIKLI